MANPQYTIQTTANNVQIIYDTAHSVVVTTAPPLHAGGALIAWNANQLDELIANYNEFVAAYNQAGDSTIDYLSGRKTPDAGASGQPGGIFAQIFVDFALISSPLSLSLDTPYIFKYAQNNGSWITNTVMFCGGLYNNTEGPVNLPFSSAFQGSPTSGVTPITQQVVTDVRLDTDFNLQVQRAWITLPQNTINTQNSAGNWMTLFPGATGTGILQSFRVNFVGRLTAGITPYTVQCQLFSTPDGATVGSQLVSLDTGSYLGQGMYYRLLQGFNERFMF